MLSTIFLQLDVLNLMAVAVISIQQSYTFRRTFEVFRNFPSTPSTPSESLEANNQRNEIKTIE